MQRIACDERPDWKEKAEAAGFRFHTISGERYWDERAYYALTLEQIERDIEAPTGELDAMCRELVGRAVADERMLKVLRIPERFWTFIAASWKRNDPSLYGRFDLSYDGNGPAKLLEYNADTPTSVFETGVFQWMWLEDAKALNIVPNDADQFNSLHERLIGGWKEIGQNSSGATDHLHLAGAIDDPEDGGTIAYMEDTARQAGLATTVLAMESIGRTPKGAFVDLADKPIALMFKLYPWEWMFREQFGAYLAGSPTRWLEPPWKSILSNKGILPLLWAMFPRHPNLLPAYFDDDPKAAELGDSFVRKPLYSREGSNVTIMVKGQAIDQDEGPYGEEGFVRQAVATLPRFAGNYAAIGSWIAAGQPCGLSVREDVSPITKNTHRVFCPTRLWGEAFPHCTTKPPDIVYGYAEPMNFQPKFDSGVPVPEPVSPEEQNRRSRRILFRLSLVGFVTALVARAVDPVVPPIAMELGVDPNSVALLSTAFALPFALVQPVLGPVADMVGKIRVMLVCLAVLLGATLLCALATDYPTLLAARIVAGIASGGIFPVGMAVIGDLIPVKERQIAIGRWLTAVISGNLLGATLAGMIADLAGWRTVFFVFAAGGAFALITAVLTLREAANAHVARFDIAGIPGRYASVLKNPKAKVCFGAVFAEGILIFGLFPFVALLLMAGGEGRASIAGIVIAGFSIGGIVYALAVPMLVRQWRGDQLMIAGGIIAALALGLVAFELAWPIQLAAFTLLGFGFYTLHASIQVQTTELSTIARGSAVSMHSFCFFVGHASGPVLYGAGFSLMGAPATIAVAAALVAMIGVICARLLRERTAAE